MTFLIRTPLIALTAALIAAPVALNYASASPAEPAVPVAAQGTDRPDSFADLSARLLPSVVNISAMQTIDSAQPQLDMPQFPPGSPFEDFFREFMERQNELNGGRGGQQPRRASSLGSGFIIDAAQGYIVTNNHVIADADEIKVILQDDTNLEAKVVGRDEKTDLALLKVDTRGQHLTAVPWGDSDAMRVGDWIVAIGNPFGLGGTVTQGIISARARDIQSGPYDDYLQTDASINRGNSGGPMFNLKGEVVGINSAIYSPSGGSVGIGFAIPANMAKSVIAQLEEFGRTKRGWLGVRIQGVTQDIADSLNFSGPRGALIAGITPGGPAEKAGLQTGDIVTKFNGRPIEDMRRLPRIVAETKVGVDAPITVWRQGKSIDLTVKVAELEQAEESGLVKNSAGEQRSKPTAPAEAKVGGLSLSTLTDTARSQYEIEDSVQGIVVTSVDPDSAAGEKGIEEGDVIVEANQAEVKTPAELVARIAEVKAAGRKSIFLLITRGDDLRFVALPIDEPARPIPEKERNRRK